jgi:hypothetical protein
MKEGTLDNIEITDSERTTNKLIRFFPILLLWIGTVWTLIISGFSSKEYLTGLTLLLITTVMFFKHASEFIILSLIIMVLGTFGLISFFPYEVFLEFGIKAGGEGVGLGIDLLLLGIGVCFIYINRKEIQKRYKEIQSPNAGMDT